jgi:hypothetical protein
MFHFQNKFEKLVHLVGFVIRKFVMMHGHMNVTFVKGGIIYIYIYKINIYIYMCVCVCVCVCVFVCVCVCV